MSEHSISTTVAGAVVETLRILNVERVFGLPGIQNIELFDALADAPFTTVTPTNESSAVFNYAEPPPYVKGAGPQMFQNLPWRIKVGVGLRYLKRSLLLTTSKNK